MDKDKPTTPFTPVVVNTGAKLVVIDTGTRPGHVRAEQGRGRPVPTNLAAAGIDRDAVDTVIISHFHGDHINGLLTADSKRRVPERRDHGAGGRVEVLVGRRRMSKAAAGSPLKATSRTSGACSARSATR